MLVLTHALNALLMVLLPVALALVLWRRTDASFGLWAVGAVTFVLAQVVHIPLNLGVARLFSSGVLPKPSDAVTVWLLPLALGLSAGVCEETARYVAFRLRTSARAWSDGMMMGAGHGGIEAIVLGLLAGLGYVNLLLLRSTDPASLGVPPEQVALVTEQVTAYWSTHPLMSLLGAVERAFAITAHLAMSLLVLQAVRRSIAWLFAAIAFHTLLDAAAVAIAPHSVLGAEAAIGVCALLAAAIVWWLQEDR